MNVFVVSWVINSDELSIGNIQFGKIYVEQEEQIRQQCEFEGKFIEQGVNLDVLKTEATRYIIHLYCKSLQIGVYLTEFADYLYRCVNTLQILLEIDSQNVSHILTTEKYLILSLLAQIAHLYFHFSY